MTVIFQDAFTEASSVALTSHTPTDVGTSWVEEINDSSTIAQAKSSDVAGPAAVSNDTQIVVTGRPNPTSADYDIEGVFTGGSAPRSNIIVGRYQDADNWYAVRIMVGANNFRLYKSTTAGGIVQLGSSSTFANTSTVKLCLSGTSLDVLENDTSEITATDSDITDPGSYGIGWGDLMVSGDDVHSSQSCDDFIVDEVAVAVTRRPQPIIFP